MSGELKPCPFCGGDDLITNANSVECESCGGSVCVDWSPGMDGREAAEVWNRRSLTLSEGLVEKARVERDELIRLAQPVIDFWGVGKLNISAMTEFVLELRAFLDSLPLKEGGVGKGESQDHAPSITAVASGWQPIQSAPSKVPLIVFDKFEGVCCAQAEEVGRPGERMWFAVGSGRDADSLHPTHWMPLPAAPSPLSDGGEGH